MIAKAIKGTGFRGVLEYDLGKEQARLIDTNMVGLTPRELASEFGEVRKLRPRLGKAVLHVSLSAAPGEHLSDSQWTHIAGRYRQDMGLENNQYIVTRHADTDHEHVHLVVNRIRFDGDVTSDSHDYRRQEIVMRAVEREFGLQQLRSSIEAPRHAATQGEIEAALRTGIASTRQRLQQLCDAAIIDCGGFTEFAQRLAAAGVALMPVTQLDDTKMSGLSYRLDGVTMKGSDLGRGYSPMGLSKRGVGYDKERDHAAVGRCLERCAAGRAGPELGGPAPGEGGQRGGVGRDAGAAGAGDGRADGRDAADTGGDRTARDGAGRTVQHADRSSRGGMAQRGAGGAAGSGGHGTDLAADGAAPLPARRDSGIADRAAGQRIVALAGTCANHPERGKRQGAGRTDQARDRSLEAARGQMKAMGCAAIVVRLVDANSGAEEMRHWSGPEMINSIAWLKRMNARGHDVSVRPDGGHGLVLLADLRQADLLRMDERGYRPAAVVEVERGRYQAWIKLAVGPVDGTLRELAAASLSRALGRDGGAVAMTEFGALAGFTVHGSHPMEGRMAPYALLYESGGGVATAAPAYLERMAQALSKPAKIYAPQYMTRHRSHGRSQ
jgi:hypothetical protein